MARGILLVWSYLKLKCFNIFIFPFSTSHCHLDANRNQKHEIITSRIQLVNVNRIHDLHYIIRQKLLLLKGEKKNLVFGIVFRIWFFIYQLPYILFRSKKWTLAFESAHVVFEVLVNVSENMEPREVMCRSRTLLKIGTFPNK